MKTEEGEEDLLFQTSQFGEDEPEFSSERCGGHCAFRV